MQKEKHFGCFQCTYRPSNDKWALFISSIGGCYWTALLNQAVDGCVSYSNSVYSNEMADYGKCKLSKVHIALGSMRSGDSPKKKHVLC